MSKDIKIFVSHRIDLDSETIDTPLYVNVRCGATLDKRENVEMLGDDTGENISKKRNSYCELTVQYWAWKNQDADYYGLCHYRRYFTFVENTFNNYNRAHHIEEEFLCDETIEKYGLNKDEQAKRIIERYDIIYPEPQRDITRLETPRGKFKTVRERWEGWDSFFIDKEIFDILLTLIKDYNVVLYECAMEYLNGSENYGCNLFVMRKDYFNKLCSFQFAILSQLESQLDFSLYSNHKYRTLGYMGEIMYGIFIHYAVTRLKANAKPFPVVYFNNTQKDNKPNPIFKANVIPIVLVSNNAYVAYVSCFIQSLIDSSSKKNKYDIIVLHKAVSDENQELLKESYEGENICIRFYAPNHIMNKYTVISNSRHPEEVGYKMLTPWILEQYDKALVVDADIIVNRDIGELFNINIDEYALAAVRDIFFQGRCNSSFIADRKYTSRINLQNPYNYINAGVMLMNLKKIRREYSFKSIVEYMQKDSNEIQDVINVVFQNDIKYINVKYNFLIEFEKKLLNPLAFAPRESTDEYYNAKKNPVIIHYSNSNSKTPKPWECPEIEFGSKFWNAARKTPFYEVILKRMWDIKVNQSVQKLEGGLAYLMKDFEKIHLIEERLNIIEKNNIPIHEDAYGRFRFPWDLVPAKSNILIYGGGVVGKTFIKQLSNHPHCNVRAIVDKCPVQTGIREYPVITIKELSGMDHSAYEMILIAIEKREIAMEIYKELELAGLDTSKIKWADPRCNIK